MFYYAELDTKKAELLKPGERYHYTVPAAVRNGEVWGLWNGKKWAVFTDGEGHKCSPVWPGEKYAREWKRAGLEAYSPRCIDLDNWIDRWLTLMTNGGCKVAVFPVGADNGFVTSPTALTFDVLDESGVYTRRAA